MRALIVLLLLTPLAYGNGNGHQHSESGESSSTSESGSASSSGVVSAPVFNNFLFSVPGDIPESVGVNRSINIEHGDYPANSAGALSIEYCTQGFSGQGDKGGLILAGSDPVCRQTRMIGAAIPEIMRLKAKGDVQRASELDNLVTETVFTMFEDEKGRRIADKSFNLFKTVGSWLLVILLFG